MLKQKSNLTQNLNLLEDPASCFVVVVVVLCYTVLCFLKTFVKRGLPCCVYY